MKRSIFIFSVIGLLIGCFLHVFSIFWELSEIRGSCQGCPINFWKNTTSTDIINIILMGSIGSLIGGTIGFIVHNIFKKLFD